MVQPGAAAVQDEHRPRYVHLLVLVSGLETGGADREIGVSVVVEVSGRERGPEVHEIGDAVRVGGYHLGTRATRPGVRVTNVDQIRERGADGEIALAIAVEVAAHTVFGVLLRVGSRARNVREERQAERGHGRDSQRGAEDAVHEILPQVWVRGDCQGDPNRAMKGVGRLSQERLPSPDVSEFVVPLDVMVRWDPRRSARRGRWADGGRAALAVAPHPDDLDQRCVVLLWTGAQSMTASDPHAPLSRHRLYDHGLDDVAWVGVVRGGMRPRGERCRPARRPARRPDGRGGRRTAHRSPSAGRHGEAAATALEL